MENQRSMLQLITGNTGAWTMPTRNRTVIKETRIKPTEDVAAPGIRLVAMVRTPHRTAIATILRPVAKHTITTSV